MTLALIHSRALLGLRAPAVTVEVHLANGLPSFTLVGLADTEVKEARERVRCAIQNAGLDFPTNKRITVNLAPADLPKDSGRFDLPIALGILAANGLGKFKFKQMSLSLKTTTYERKSQSSELLNIKLREENFLPLKYSYVST